MFLNSALDVEAAGLNWPVLGDQPKISLCAALHTGQTAIAA
jgi:hypothetical protein